MLIVMGSIDVSPADAASFRDDIVSFGEKARTRDGCLFFAVAHNPPQAGHMLVVERWRDQDALDTHLAATETVAFVARWRDRMKVELTRFDVTNERAFQAS